MVPSLSRHIFGARGIKVSARAATKRLSLVAACIIASAIAANDAEAQCLRVTTLRGKARLSTSPVGFNGKCPAGTVSIGASTGAVGAPGAQGPQGPQGQQGSQGPQGLAGARGASAFDVIPSGTTVYGVIGIRDYRNANESFDMYASLPARASKPITGADIIIKANTALLSECSAMRCLPARQQAGQNRCQGTAEKPTAAPGTVCFYPTYIYGGLEDQSFDGSDIWTGESSGSTAGFSLSYWTDIAAAHWVEGVWAYTAP
jgi:hypothetical protein